MNIHWFCHSIFNSKSNMENHCWRKCLSQSCLKNMKADTDAESFCKAFCISNIFNAALLENLHKLSIQGSGIEGLLTVIRPDIWAMQSNTLQFASDRTKNQRAKEHNQLSRRRLRIVYIPTNSFYQVFSAESYSKHGFNIPAMVGLTFPVQRILQLLYLFSSN